MSNITVITPPHSINCSLSIRSKKIFLGGSIEMGEAVDWQHDFITKATNSWKYSDYFIFNPRRDDWDSSWEQKYESPQFFQQVTWELEAMEKSDYIVIYFDPKTKSPISLLELGLHAHSKKLLVVCPEGFWRKGNVDMVCARYGINQLDSLADVGNLLKY